MFLIAVFALVALVMVLGVSVESAAGQDNGENPDQSPRVFIPAVMDQYGDLSSEALRIASERSGTPVDELKVEASAIAQYPVSGVTSAAFKIYDERTGAGYGVVLAPNGQEVDPNQLMAAEEAAYAARYGKYDEVLAQAIGAATDARVLDVVIWLKELGYQGPARPEPGRSPDDAATAAQMDEFLKQAEIQRAAFVETITGPAAAKLASQGIEVESAQLVPVLYASLPIATLAEVAAWDEVDRIYQAGVFGTGDPEQPATPREPELEVARSAIGAHIVHGRNILGFGAMLGEIEVGGRVSANNPYLNLYNPGRVIQDSTNVCAAASGHSTGVAGIMVSSHLSRFGIAPGAALRAGGTCDGNAANASANLESAATRAVTWGARALNLSYGYKAPVNRIPDAHDRFYDSIVYNNERSVVVAAGNFGGGHGWVATPALAYNVLTVGNFDDHNTVTWDDDTMDTSSSYVNPTSSHSDREKPEVAAPGHLINSTTTASPWTGNIGSGTSFAAPMVASMTGLMFQRDPGVNYPETIKAIVMVSAQNNIEGATRLSDRDGAGGVAADLADDLVRRIRGNWGWTAYSCSTATPLNVTTMSLVAGKRTRIAIVWYQNPTYASYSSQPSADLDLRILNSAGTQVAYSVSYDNTYEIVEFTPSTSGVYKLQVTRYRCNATPKYLGWAWSRVP